MDTKKISTEVNIHREMHIDQSLELIGSSITLLHDGNYMPYNTLSIGYGHTIKEGQKKEQIPPGRQLVRIGPESFFFEFENGHVYTIHPQFIIPDEPQYTIENMPNRMNRPPIPTLFDETKEIYRPDPLVLRYSIPFGAIIGGVLIGSIADSGAGLAIGGALGALGGYVFCYLSEVGNGKELVRTDPHLTAINENKNQMVLYGQKVAEIEKYNNAQLEILNSDVDKKNEQLKQHNASRDIIIIKNLTTEEKWGYNISGYNNEVYKIEAK